MNRERIHVIHNAIVPTWGKAAARTRHNFAHPWEFAGRKSSSSSSDNCRGKDRLTSGCGSRTTDWLIVGEGPERGRIEERIRATGREAHVTLVRRVPSAKPYFGVADIAVLSSLSEGSPNALLEAMAAGLPVVATSVGGIPEIVTHEESAMLVPPGDRVAMAAAIGRVLREEGLALRIIQRARELVEAKHSPEERTRQICEIYRNLLAKDGAGVIRG